MLGRLRTTTICVLGLIGFAANAGNGGSGGLAHLSIEEYLGRFEAAGWDVLVQIQDDTERLVVVATRTSLSTEAKGLFGVRWQVRDTWRLTFLLGYGIFTFHGADGKRMLKAPLGAWHEAGNPDLPSGFVQVMLDPDPGV